MKISIRGIGVVSPLGDSRSSFEKDLYAGRVAPGPSAIWPEVSAGEIAGFNAKNYVLRKGLNVLSRAAKLTAASLAILRGEVAGLLDPSEKNPAPRIGLVVGTAYGHVESKVRYSKEAAVDGVRLVSPILFPNTIINSLGGHAAILNGWQGPNSTLVAGCRSALEAVDYGMEFLRAGKADAVAVAACDEVSRPLLEGFSRLGLLSRADPRGEDASIPFAPGRSGIYPGEAGVALLLTRGPPGGGGPIPGDAPCLGTIHRGGSASTVKRTLKEAVREAMELALTRAGLKPGEIGWLALSGNGSGGPDAAEAEAVEEIFGGDVPAAAIKRQCGETFAAGGLLGILAATISLERGEIPPTPGVAHGLLSGLSPSTRRLTGPPAVLVSAVDGEGASALVVQS